MVQELLIAENLSDIAFVHELKIVYISMIQKANVNISEELPHMISFDSERMVDFIRLEAAKERRFYSIDFVNSLLD